jgi:hypothetical protein
MCGGLGLPDRWEGGRRSSAARLPAAVLPDGAGLDGELERPAEGIMLASAQILVTDETVDRGSASQLAEVITVHGSAPIRLDFSATRMITLGALSVLSQALQGCTAGSSSSASASAIVRSWRSSVSARRQRPSLAIL